MLLLSIITINYNNAEGLKKTVSSVLNQAFKNFEYIIIDGGSTDGSPEVMSLYAKHLAYSVSEKDKGIYNAMNKGISVANGEYCLFLNSGDYFADKHVLEKVFSVKRTVDILYGDMQTIDESGNIQHLKMPARTGMMHLYADTIWHPVSFIKTSLFKKFGPYNEAYKITGDYELFLRFILKHKASTEHLPFEISVFDTTGISSIPGKQRDLVIERRNAQDTYMPAFLLFFFRLYSKIRA